MGPKDRYIIGTSSHLRPLDHLPELLAFLTGTTSPLPTLLEIWSRYVHCGNPIENYFIRIERNLLYSPAMPLRERNGHHCGRLRRKTQGHQRWMDSILNACVQEIGSRVIDISRPPHWQNEKEKDSRT